VLEQFLRFASQFIESNQAYRADFLFITKFDFDGDWIVVESEEERWEGRIHIGAARAVWDEDFLDSEQEHLAAICESDVAIARNSESWKMVVQSLTWLLQFCT